LEKESDNFELRPLTWASHLLHHGLHTQNSRASQENLTEKSFNYSLSAQ